VNSVLYLLFCFVFMLFNVSGFNARADTLPDLAALEEKIAALVDPLVTEKLLPGYYLAIYAEDKLLVERAKGFADEKRQLKPDGHTLYAIASMTKPLTAIAMLHLIERSDLTLDSEIRDFLPAFSDPMVAPDGSYDKQLVLANSPITIRQLMTHTSGLTYSSTVTGIGAIADAYRDLGILTLEASAESQLGKLGDHIDSLAELPLVAQPGTKFTYSVGYDVLARIIEVVSGKTFEVYLTENVLIPLGMTDTKFLLAADDLQRLAQLYAPLIRTIQVPGTPRRYQKSNMVPRGQRNFGEQLGIIGGGSGLISSANDYARFLSYLINKGKGFPEILQAEKFELLLTDQIGKDLGPDLMVESLGVQTRNMVFSLALGISLNTGDAQTEMDSYDFLGWAGAFNTQFWLDENNRTYGVFMAQHIPSRYRVTEGIEDAVDAYMASKSR
jgi:CubicO group peptidase (beta-lactamase class C family)